MQLIRDKHKILEAAIRQHKSVIHDFKQRIRDMMGNNGNVNEEEYDNQEQSFKAETSAKVNLLSEQLAFANGELEELIKMKTKIGSEDNQVRRGSVVKTDREHFLFQRALSDFMLMAYLFLACPFLVPCIR